MNGVVVGLSRRHACDRALRWASTEACLHGLDLTGVHAWKEPVDVAVDLDPTDLAALAGHASFHGVQGSPRWLLAAIDAHLLVLGVRAPSPHMATLVRDVVRASVHVPVAIVPEPGNLWANGVVTVGVCGTSASAAALRWAAREARLRDESGPRAPAGLDVAGVHRADPPVLTHPCPPQERRKAYAPHLWFPDGASRMLADGELCRRGCHCAPQFDRTHNHQDR